MSAPEFPRPFGVPPLEGETLLTHGANVDCPEVQQGEWKFCHGHPKIPAALAGPESAAEHLRNALMPLLERVLLKCDAQAEA